MTAARRRGYPLLGARFGEYLLSAVLRSISRTRPTTRRSGLAVGSPDCGKRSAALAVFPDVASISQAGQATPRRIRRESSPRGIGLRERVFVVPNPNALSGDRYKWEFRRRMTQLRPEPLDTGRPGARSSLERVTGCLSLFRTYGTHFVSKVLCGERIFQVFAYPPERFTAVRAAYASGANPLSGPRATAFSSHTTPFTPNNYGTSPTWPHSVCQR